jgi:hypothetical protein
MLLKLICQFLFLANFTTSINYFFPFNNADEPEDCNSYTELERQKIP